MNELNFGALAFAKLNEKLPRETLLNRPMSRAYVNGTRTHALQMGSVYNIRWNIYDALKF